MKEFKCFQCKGKCNKKGYPSISKYSKVCNENRGNITVKQQNIFDRLSKRLLGLMFDDKTGKRKKVKGFR